MFALVDYGKVLSMTRQRRFPDPTDEKYKCYVKYCKKKVAWGPGDPSNGLHDPPLETIKWNAERKLFIIPRILL